MAKASGIKEFAFNMFVATLPKRAELGNTEFRRTVMNAIMKEFDVSLASSATHYNTAFIAARANPQYEPLLVGLGRPADKKGGRKPKAVVDAAAAAAGAVAPQEAVAEAAAEPEVAAEPVKLVDVIQVKTGKVVVTGLTVDEANALIEKAAAAKKGKLAIKPEELPQEAAASTETATAEVVQESVAEVAAETVQAEVVQEEVAPTETATQETAAE